MQRSSSTGDRDVDVDDGNNPSEPLPTKTHLIPSEIRPPVVGPGVLEDPALSLEEIRAAFAKAAAAGASDEDDGGDEGGGDASPQPQSPSSSPPPPQPPPTQPPPPYQPPQQQQQQPPKQIDNV